MSLTQEEYGLCAAYLRWHAARKPEDARPDLDLAMIGWAEEIEAQAAKAHRIESTLRAVRIMVGGEEENKNV